MIDDLNAMVDNIGALDKESDVLVALDKLTNR